MCEAQSTGAKTPGFLRWLLVELDDYFLKVVVVVVGNWW